MTGYPDLDTLAVLLLVARKGSIGQAAGDLGLSQPSVSRRMVALESALQVQLLHRTRQGTSLTPTGRVVVDWASTLLEAADDFRRSVDALQAKASVSLRVAVSMTIAEYHAPLWVARLHRTSPDYAVSIEVHNSREVAELVASRAVDIGFVESPTVPRGLRRRRIGWDELTLAVPRDHPWAQRGEITAAELAAAPLLVREPGSGTRETVERALRRQGLTMSVGLTMASNTALKSAAMAGIGPVVLSEQALRTELAAGRLDRVAVTDLSLRRPLSAVLRGTERIPPGVTALLSVVGGEAGPAVAASG
jgi:DNA-binding transcriptional LysR family regulator